MTKENQVTTAEAQSALESLNKIGNETISLSRPPLWQIIILSLLSGIFTFSMAAAVHENMWGLGMWISGISIFLWVLFWKYSELLLGVRVKPMPTSGSGKVFVGLQVLYFSIVLLVGRWATESGRAEIRIEGTFPIADLPLAPYIAAIIFSVSVGFLTYKYPTNEWVKEDASK